MTVSEALDLLASKRKSLRCDEVRDLLEDLGFVLKAMKIANHYTYTHPELAKFDFRTGDFACDHGKNGAVKPCYTRKVRRVIEMYAEVLRDARGERQ